jgi:DNA topoisomerase-2
VRYILKFSRVTLAELQKRGKLEDTLKMREGESENLTTLDENGKLKVFERAEDIIRYFVDFRLGYYEKRKAHLLATLARDFAILSARAQFVKAIVDKKIEVANVKKADIITALELLAISKHEGSYDFLLSMSIHTLTAEKYEELLRRVDEISKEIARTEKMTAKDFYRQDLKDLRKQVVKTYGQ